MQRTKLYTAFLVTALAYVILGYILQREAFYSIWFFFSVAFAAYLYLLSIPGKSMPIKGLFWAGIIFRLVFIVSIPVLSDDYVRFIWDGQLWVHEINPFLHLPNDLINDGVTQKFALGDRLALSMNDLQKRNFTCYPPLNQLLFLLPAMLFKESVLGNLVIMRLFIILADIGTYFFGKKIVNKLNLPVSRIFIYFLNPLVIVELTGNLHFEAVMIFFLTVAVYLFLCQRHLLSAVLLALSASIKLIPLMLLPLFIKNTGFRKGVPYAAVVGSVFLVLLSPLFISSGVQGFMQSINLYFRNFEFNASVFYLLREVGFAIKGYDMVFVIGPTLAAVALIFILIISFHPKNKGFNYFTYAMVPVLLVYYFLATTVHPWYITTILAMSCFNRLKTPLFWSYFAFLSYHAYATPTFDEKAAFLIIEYSAVYAVFIYELISRTRDKNLEKMTVE